VGAYLSRFGKLMSGRLGWKTALDSDYIQRRIKDMPPAVALAMQGLRSEKPNAIREAARRIGSLISGFDGLFTAGTYAIVYDYQMTQARQNGMGGQEAADYAREATERIVDEIAEPVRGRSLRSTAPTPWRGPSGPSAARRGKTWDWASTPEPKAAGRIWAKRSSTSSF
jgi:hypothetical protein